MYQLIWTPKFTKSAKRFAKQHPNLRTKFASILRNLEHDPFLPHLKFHKLSGEMEGLQAISLTYDYRIILTVAVTAQEVILLDIGSHDEVYRA